MPNLQSGTRRFSLPRFRVRWRWAAPLLLALGLVALAKMALALPFGPTAASLERILTQLIATGRVSTSRVVPGMGAVMAASCSTSARTSAGLGFRFSVSFNSLMIKPSATRRLAAC